MNNRPVWLGEDRRGWDHVRLHESLLFHPKVGPYELAVYAAICWHAEVTTGEAPPSRSVLAEIAQCSDRRVWTALQVLRSEGFVEITERVGQTHVFRLLPPPRHHVPGSISTPAPASRDPGTTFRVPRQQVPGTVFNKNQKQKEKNTSTHVDIDVAQFEEFWNSYPKRNGKRLEKRKAVGTWARMSEQDRTSALAAIEHYRAACDGGLTLAKDAFRWLRDKSWSDWLTPVQTPTVALYRGPSVSWKPKVEGEDYIEHEDGSVEFSGRMAKAEAAR